ncbi:MAG: response regulator, partial [Candidatus Hydrogenedentes bacterium]|nr:response regulator [Candidatus Hydrogenedentota bacterium]
YSEVGKGTTFKIYLPRVEEAAYDQLPAPPKSPARGTETILLVEDDEALRNLSQRILTSAGYTVLVAARGEEALSLMARHAGPVHLLLTDVVMPGMSGGVLAGRLMEDHPSLKVLYMSGYTDNAIVNHGVLEEGTQFVGKPFTSAQLTQKVREV